ncbi:hypothetical protein RVIR1_10020 [Candidatus Rickettsiella viridis]|uniref:Uncharacterized protein n=1 Tax=Candidatus Rickettsiella viridis TaxID=676208 RepID=A0A2Z5UWM2_9COXI|nr:hypothetical protein [Candidatus Rickettsiella viridis]BBB15475.1 hypothetical protein RVIR1_10020 [Candidatus Rickettsiella viridis]
MPVIKNNNNRSNANPEPTSEPRPIFYRDYLKLMHAIHSQNLHKVMEAVKNTSYLRFIINYRDPERHFETPLRFALAASKGNCSGALIEFLMSQTANTRMVDEFGVTPYQFGAKHCRNWLEVEEIFDHALSRGDTIITVAPVIDATTSLIPYKAKSPYEYHLVIHIPMSLFKGTFTALSRFIFEKLQKHSLFARRHSTLFFVAQSVTESMLMSTMNLLYFPSIKGTMSNLNVLASGATYFSMDLALTFSFSLINSKLQPLLDGGGEKESRVRWASKKLTSSVLFTLFFLLSNLSIILGEKFQDHKVEAVLNIFFNAIVASFIHQVAYAGVNSITNWLVEKSEQASAPPEIELQKSIPFSVMNPLAEKEESPIYQNVGLNRCLPLDASFDSGHSSGYSSSLTESIEGPPMDKKPEVKPKPFFANRGSPLFLMQAAIEEKSEPVYEVPVYKVPSSQTLVSRR